MTEKMFKNRVKELAFLNELYEKGTAKLIVLYGRRRVGKTELLKELAELSRPRGRMDFLIEQMGPMAEELEEGREDSPGD